MTAQRRMTMAEVFAAEPPANSTLCGYCGASNHRASQCPRRFPNQREQEAMSHVARISKIADHFNGARLGTGPIGRQGGPAIGARRTAQSHIVSADDPLDSAPGLYEDDATFAAAARGRGAPYRNGHAVPLPQQFGQGGYSQDRHMAAGEGGRISPAVFIAGGPADMGDGEAPFDRTLAFRDWLARNKTPILMGGLLWFAAFVAMYRAH